MVDGKELVEGGDLGVRTMKGTVRPLNELSLEDCVARLRIQSSDLRRLGVSIEGSSNSLLVKHKDPGLHHKAPNTANWSYAIGDGEGSFRTR